MSEVPLYQQRQPNRFEVPVKAAKTSWGLWEGGVGNTVDMAASAGDRLGHPGPASNSDGGMLAKATAGLCK